LMYYFVPKAANRPVYSYRLSIIHFWSLIFLYIWAGPHHLLYTALPDWAQNLGTVFSVMLIFPSWGGMINGLLTLRGAWDKVRESAILKFFVVAITAYGMATFEGPMLAFKNLNAIAHYTDWIVGHVHIGTLGWNGFIIAGMLYWLVKKLYKTELYSIKLANYHFWIGTIGILFYSMPLYIAGFTQAFLWKQFNEAGVLVYGNFLETVTQIIPMYAMRAFGGTLYFTGFLILAYNLIMTAKQGSKVEDELAEAAPLELISGKRNLPAFLIQNPGVNSGLMIPQYASASAVSQNKQLSTPASVDSIESSNGQEDHVSMGANAATKAFLVNENTEKVLAIELLTASQALHFRKLKTSSFLSSFTKSEVSSVKR